MERVCSVVAFDNKLIQRKLGRTWELGPCVVRQDPSFDCISLTFNKQSLKNTLVPLNEFKGIILENPMLPVVVSFSIEGSRGPYGFGDIEFDEKVMCRYIGTNYLTDTVELNFELVQKGKELGIFNGVSCDSERAQHQKPLFWASIFKGDIH